MIAISSGTEATIAEQINSLGANLIFVMGGFGGGRGSPFDGGSTGTNLVYDDATAIGELDPEAMTFRPNQTLYATISDSTGIPEETLQQGVTDGSTLAEVITANGGDLEAVREALEDVFAERPLQEGMDLGQWIDGMLLRQRSRGRRVD